ncbi:HAD-superfamily hydrolase, subfamily IIB [Psychromonas ingrahamii 37]|uniref:HAD-superfamily hydrolase, subfamily IIB n=1 Tax=Psychromonas ingrahamii (strain DSM 17664 / CCUG 51855 / 37) TaxID=357804 RepID=A1SWI0_PSYIN|nr:HAD-IIB family hydrolase [Psychromonas ingrahamii]ABM03845.1 HAD-superfamily hydrolase, subfamily IIB [Psychromonas ingrahamii 37]
MPKPLADMSVTQASAIKWLLTDVDDTLTWQGKLPPETLIALEKLTAVGINVVAITGASAGWCDQIARLWPVHGVIGENGAFWMQKNATGFITRESIPIDTMKSQQMALIKHLRLLLEDYPDIDFACDQSFRYCDVAINLSQDRPPVDQKICDELLIKVRNLTVDGQSVNATLSSIHLNVWIGNHNKRLSAEQYLFAHNVQMNFNEIAYIGDSLNDEAMFAWLPLTFGVKNIERLLPQFETKPAYITNKNGGYGFAELADFILQAKESR